jgi:hypothetical protein
LKKNLLFLLLFLKQQAAALHNHKTAGILLRALYYSVELRLRLQKTKSRQDPLKKEKKKQNQSQKNKKKLGMATTI